MDGGKLLSMRSAEGYIAYLDAADITDAEREILKGYIDQRNAIKPTAPRTKGKQAYEGVWICSILHENGAGLHSCTVHDLLKVANTAGSGSFTKNSRQTKIVVVKALARYIDRFHHKIKDLDLLMDDVKAGTAAKNRKPAITLEQWHTIRSLPMSAKHRAMLYLLYYSYHRPGELALLKWSGLRQEGGEIQYDIKFKTEKMRTIVMRAEAVDVLETWRNECGALLTDDTPIFPAPGGDKYRTITHLAKLFRRIKKATGIPGLMPSILRNSGPQHDLEAGYPVAYVCLRMWGEPYNELINLYTKPDSGKIQRDQHGKAGAATGAVLGDTREYLTATDMIAKQAKELDQLRRRMDANDELLRKRGLSNPGVS